MSGCQAPLCLQSAMTDRVVWHRWSPTVDSCSKFSPLVSSFSFCRSLSSSRSISILNVSFCARIDYLWIIHSQCLCRFLSLFLFHCLPYIPSPPALFSKCPFFPFCIPSWNLIPLSAPHRTWPRPLLLPAEQRQTITTIFSLVLQEYVCFWVFEVKKGYFLKKCLYLLVFLLFFCVLLPLSKT